jgi:hypothetical protein
VDGIAATAAALRVDTSLVERTDEFVARNAAVLDGIH